jgi:dihydroflavonol-4-reductase
VVVLNPAYVAGPDDPRRRLRTVLAAVKLGLVRIAPPGGLTVCDVRQVAATHVTALTRGRSGERYVLGGPHLRWRELFDRLAVALGAPRPLATVPEVALRLFPLQLLERITPFEQVAHRLEALTSDRFYSSSKAVRELGYQEPDVDRLVAETVASYERDHRPETRSLPMQ